jgi:hypothetical protein
VRIQNSQVRGVLLCCVTLGACLAGMRPAAAEVTLIEKDGWTFFTEGRVNVFGSVGFGDDFPRATPNPMNGPTHGVLGAGQPFTAGFDSFQGDVNGKYLATRFRSGFLGSILAFGTKRHITETTTARAYISLWGTAEAFSRDRTQDVGGSVTKGFDVREGYVAFDGPWGSVGVGHQSGIFGGISTEIDYLYAHNYGLGLPCLDIYYATCGHVGTGAISPGFAPGFVYTTPDVNGLRLKVGLYDPVRLLGVWERVPYPRPEGAIMYERRLSPGLAFKLQGEGMYQPMKQIGGTDETSVWGLSAGGRLEAGPFRLGLSVFRGRGLGAYVALQNASSTFSNVDRELRYFTGLYSQTAFVTGPWQFSLGLGRLFDDQLAVDKTDSSTSNLKTQTGASAVINYAIAGNLVLDVDYFYFQTDWWGAPNAVFNGTDPNGNAIVMILPGYQTPEKQVISFLNIGATFHW